MSTYFVTGGTGFLGQHLIRRALEAGDKIRVLTRSPDRWLRALPLEIVEGDLGHQSLDAKAWKKALSGCDAIFHLAGFVSRDPRDGQKMMRLHVDGTRALFDAAEHNKIGRIVLVSTSGTTAVSEQPAPVLDEAAPYPLELVGRWPYYLSKIYQEKLAAELAATYKIELITVNPSLLLGPGDERESSTGDVKNFLRGKIPLAPPGGINFVDVRDAAQAVYAAVQKGRAGQRYLIGGPNWTFADFFSRLARIAKTRPPFGRFPLAWADSIAKIADYGSHLLPMQLPFDQSSIEMSKLYWYCDSKKAETELGFRHRDPSETLLDTVNDVRGRMI